MSRTGLDTFIHLVTFSWKMAAVSTPGMMFWSRRQAAVFRLCSLLVMMYESNSWKTWVVSDGAVVTTAASQTRSVPSCVHTHRVAEVVVHEEHLQELPQAALWIRPTCRTDTSLIPVSTVGCVS